MEFVRETDVFAGWAFAWGPALAALFPAAEKIGDVPDSKEAWGLPPGWNVTQYADMEIPKDKKKWAFFLHIDTKGDSTLRGLVARAIDEAAMREGRCCARRFGVPDDAPIKLMRMRAWHE